MIEVEKPKGNLVCHGPPMKEGPYYRYTWAVVTNFADRTVNLIIPHPDYQSLYFGVAHVRFRLDNQPRRWWQILFCVRVLPTIDEALWEMEDLMERYGVAVEEFRARLEAHIEAQNYLNDAFKI